jgi:hypothetical protein
MTHLTDLEIVDQIEGVLPAARAAHAAECGICRAKIEDLTESLGRAKGVDMPEPSPLFWEHFSARIRKAVADAPEPRSFDWPSSQPAAWKWAIASVLIALFVGAGAWRFTRNVPDKPANVVENSNSSGLSRAEDPFSVDTAADGDQAWGLVQSLADEVEWNDSVTADLDVRPGWVDRAALNLSSDERDELLRLLKAEAKRPGA